MTAAEVRLAELTSAKGDAFTGERSEDFGLLYADGENEWNAVARRWGP